VDIRSETEFAAEEAEHGYEEEEVQGRCAAVLSNGRRCPNAALPGSRYCGLESHQALAGIDSDNIVDLGPEDGATEAVADTQATEAAADMQAHDGGSAFTPPGSFAEQPELAHETPQEAAEGQAT
jgi:N utilization substance protein A